MLIKMYAYNYNIENAEGFDEDFFNKIYNTKKRIIKTLVDATFEEMGNTKIDEKWVVGRWGYLLLHKKFTPVPWFGTTYP